MKLSNRFFIAICALFVFALATAQDAVAAHMYVTARVNPGSDPDADTILRQVVTQDPLSITDIGPAGLEAFAGIDFQPGTNTLFASSGNGGTNPRSLFTVDIGTGAATLVGATGAGTFEIAFGTDGTLYATAESSLYTVNPGTGVATIVGSFVNSTRIEGIAVDPTTGFLHGINWDTSEYWRIDTSSGLASSLGVFADLEMAIPSSISVIGLGIDSDGNAFATTSGPAGGIYALDTVNFTSSFVGLASLGRSVTDVAFLVPEPTGIALALLGLTFSCVRTRRKR